MRKQGERMNEKTLNFDAYKAKKEGIVTTHSLLENAFNNAENFEQVVVITIDNEGYVQTGWSDGGGIRTIGLLEVAKQQIMDGMRE